MANSLQEQLLKAGLVDKTGQKRKKRENKQGMANPENGDDAGMPSRAKEARRKAAEGFGTQQRQLRKPREKIAAQIAVGR